MSKPPAPNNWQVDPGLAALLHYAAQLNSGPAARWMLRRSGQCFPSGQGYGRRVGDSPGRTCGRYGILIFVSDKCNKTHL
jgi:hypothetical protein